jgi:hypothetical protein
MFSSIRNRITPGLVVAVVALVAALGGTATAAKSLFISKSSQIKNGAVTSADIKNGTVQQGDLSKTLQKKLGVSVSGASGANGINGVNGANGTQGPKGDKGDKGDAGDPAIPTVGLTNISGALLITNNAAWSTIGALSQTVTVPAGAPMRLVATFSAESACYGGGSDNWCSIRIVVDGNELTPATGTNFAFDSNDDNTETNHSWEAHSIQRYSDVLAPGDHTVIVQGQIHGTATHRIDDAVLSTMLVRG